MREWRVFPAGDQIQGMAMGEGAGQLEPGADLKANEVNQSNSEALGAEMNLSQ